MFYRIFSLKIPIIPILKMKKLRRRTDGTLVQVLARGLTAGQRSVQSHGLETQRVCSLSLVFLRGSAQCWIRDSGESDPIPSRNASLWGKPSTDTRARAESGQLCPRKGTSRDISILRLPSSGTEDPSSPGRSWDV